MQVNTIFSDLLKLLPRYEFDKIVDSHKGNRYTKTFTGQQELTVLLFSQIRGQDSLREIETSLRTQAKKWYHIGLKGVSRSTLSDSLKKTRL